MPHGIVIGTDTRFYWNVDQHVGPGCANSAGDVELIQFAYFCMASNGGLTFDSTLLSLARRITPGEPYDGTASDKLSQCIARHQKVRGRVVDGRVSPMSNSTGSYAPGATWILVPLNVHMAITLGSIWPRLRDHASCPARLALTSNVSLILRNTPRAYEL
jgi:hypothetical protein